MMQKIIIRNFGPIKECEIDLAQFIVLTGKQAADKSTVAKAVYYFFLVKERCFDFITGSKNRSVDILKSNLRALFLLQTFYDLFGRMVFSFGDCSLEYTYNEKTERVSKVQK